MKKDQTQILLKAEVEGPEEALEEGLSLLAEDWGGCWVLSEVPLRAAFFLKDPQDLPRFEAQVRKVGLSLVRTEECPVEDWGRRFREHFRPLRVGRRLWIVPPWARGRASGEEIEIVIDPGQAFGTGQHPSTALVLETLEEFFQERPWTSVLDVGTGSGILALAAAKLGAPKVVGLDVDPVAVEEARRNATLNALDLEFSTEPLERHPGRYQLVLANISALELRRLAPALSGHLLPEGRLLLSGFLEKEIPEMLEIYRPLGFSPLRVRSKEEWGFLALVREKG
ncbi:methyltransferase domain-containing protein [Thermosulfurimonas marina]|uniref:Ribosomal protein L11 methyltransferase n=1 Tax=Thermosulfurimonas marina TaxID=2047767 RepID=A0A6H1WSG7_9BACT|nr:50S ribosomal protein L11 methyltransferase [Thermosulfurimonas marina]QJA06111.1 methyltransferase domain-containing protein [Thermosulfurimonas marina]